MRRIVPVILSMGVLASFLAVSSSALRAQSPVVSLYSPNKQRNEPRNSCLNFHTGISMSSSARCDLRYGALYAGDELDWFESSTAEGDRSVIKDLGLLYWTDNYKVSTVEPLPKLKAGEERQISVDTSGADGADGADGDGVVRPRPGSRPKNDGKPKVDPLFVKAIIGHLYVIHVVDDVRDFYALFRVEALERGDNCTISWRLVHAPDTEGR
jgi:hypothetical protein